MGGVHLDSYSAAEALEMIQDGQFVSVGQGKYTIIIDDGPPPEYLKNKHYEIFVFNYDTEHGKPETWSEDGFSEDYKKEEQLKHASSS